MKETNRTFGVKPYGGSAGGWGALKAVADAIRGQMAVKQDVIALFRVNQPQGLIAPAAPGLIRSIRLLLSFAKTGPKRCRGKPLVSVPRPIFSRLTRSAICGRAARWIWKAKGG